MPDAADGHAGGPPREEPIGLLVVRVAKAVERAFDDALAAVGGSRPTWLILLAVLTGAGRTQATLASRVGISGPTLTHHLDRLEAAGLLARRHDEGNRRIRRLELTPAGHAAFHLLRGAAAGFDARLHTALAGTDVAALRAALAALAAAVDDGGAAGAWPPPTSGPPVPDAHHPRPEEAP